MKSEKDFYLKDALNVANCDWKLHHIKSEWEFIIIIYMSSQSWTSRLESVEMKSGFNETYISLLTLSVWVTAIEQIESLVST